MSKHAFNKIMRGLDDVRAYLDGTADKRRYRVHTPKLIAMRRRQKAKKPGDQTPKGSK